MLSAYQIAMRLGQAAGWQFGQHLAPTLAAPAARGLASWALGPTTGAVSRLAKNAAVEHVGYQAFAATQTVAPGVFAFSGGLAVQAAVLGGTFALQYAYDKFKASGNLEITQTDIENDCVLLNKIRP